MIKVIKKILRILVGLFIIWIGFGIPIIGFPALMIYLGYILFKYFKSKKAKKLDHI